MYKRWQERTQQMKKAAAEFWKWRKKITNYRVIESSNYRIIGLSELKRVLLFHGPLDFLVFNTVGLDDVLAA